tara:strand:- start:1004 stop:1723 length:720 start_codon:yes stop_codon:yes gene_type:complete
VKNIIAITVAFIFASPAFAQDCVILLHGLARSKLSMKAVEWRLEKADYIVVNNSYPSTRLSIPELSELSISQSVSECNEHNSTQIHFVTHSLGGILLRQYFADHDIKNLGRSVMLGPPNQGSKLADYIQSHSLGKKLQPQAGRQLGTGLNAVPKGLGPVAFEVGVIAGTRNHRVLVSRPLDGPNDGTVTVAETRVAGMADFIQLPATHTFMMWKGSVLDQVEYFLQNGQFDHGEIEPLS